VTYDAAETDDVAHLDLGLLYRSLFPCEPEHSLASACAARGVTCRAKSQALAVGRLFVRVVD
jgi:hypothetical protein